MRQHKDFIEREIEKLTLLLQSLIEKVSGLSFVITKTDIDEVDKIFKYEFDLNIHQICKMDSKDFIQKFSKLHHKPAEQLTRLLYQLVIRVKNSQSFDKKLLAEKTIILIDVLNQNSSTFSIESRQMIYRLEQFK